MNEANAARFETLRSRYMAAKYEYDKHDLMLCVKYGSGYRESWIGKGERTRLTKLALRRDRTRAAMIELIERISGRDFMRGIPASWLVEQLSYEDCIRPASEPLSVQPPKAYGY